MTTQDRARQLIARQRQQSQNRRAAMLGRSTHEISRSEVENGPLA
ncbi:hypothetical protein [Pseudanabaena sp. FACHB-2040]|nr:hypothetical protein [Pseudanabaena sp. FACHB-2040]